MKGMMVGWLCLATHRQRGHLETAPPFTVPCTERETWFLHRSHQELNPAWQYITQPLHHTRSTMKGILITEYQLVNESINFQWSIIQST